MRYAYGFLLLLAFPLIAAPADPAVAVRDARNYIAAKRYVDAADVLKRALAGVDQVEPAVRETAETAIHFYSAVAFSGLQEDTEATAHLEKFFELQPHARLTEPEKYELHFVALFRRTQPQTGPRDEHAELRFEYQYPGFSPEPSATGAAEYWPVALRILASKEEKRDWEATVTSGDQRRFIDEFWKRRDPSPATPENEFRAVFDRRVAFADRAFESSGQRGATSDRGRVFVLLGVPSSVRRRPLTPYDPIIIVERNKIVNGWLEQWVYANTQLPRMIAKPYVTYRFVNQEGIGEGVMQREDSHAVQALILAMNPNDANKK